ncbi:MAG: rod shape-determining protein MreC [Anaerolineae bacterium]|nr:rod shape-determining protein MreC [Anaerolineae bacterium]
MPRAGRIFTFAMTLMVVFLLIFFSSQGALGPFQGIVSAPLNLVQSVVGGGARQTGSFLDNVSEFRRLEQRNADLEEALAIYQAELALLREKEQDYDRLAALVEYDRFSPEDREYVTCDVIGGDTTGLVQAIWIDCGRRDGVNLLDPVVTERGMVGRVTQLSATGAEVVLVIDPSSSINVRLQTTREDGVVIGQFTGDLIMSFIDLNAAVQEGDFVLTNGLGQTLPADLILGQVLNVTLAENELYQEARIRSLVDFDTLEIVQVIVNFEPVDVSVFEQTEEDAP